MTHDRRVGASDASAQLLSIYTEAAKGRFPSRDNATVLINSVVGAKAGVVAFTNHSIVAADVDGSWLRSHVRDEIGSTMTPQFLHELENKIGATADTQDLVLAAIGRGLDVNEELTPLDQDFDHPRIDRARHFRTDVKSYSMLNGSAVLIFGKGFAGRSEISIEVLKGRQAQGIGKRLARIAVDTSPCDQPIFAQVAPGNTASLRMLLGAGFEPICSEVLFFE